MRRNFNGFQLVQLPAAKQSILNYNTQSFFSGCQLFGKPCDSMTHTVHCSVH